MSTTKDRKMTKHVKIMIAIVAVFGVIAVTAHAMERGGQSHWRGAWAGHGDHGIERLCRHRGAGRIENLTALVDSFAAFDGEQRGAWTRLKAAIGEGEGVLQDACETTGDETATVPARLARLETLLEAGARAVAVVRPVADAFYGTLDEDQRTALDKLAARRHC